MNEGTKTVSYGNGDERIIVTLLDAADELGFCGTVQSPLFVETIYIIMDPTIAEDRNYDFACFAYGADRTPFIIAEDYVIAGLHQDTAEAKTVLFHELGHHMEHTFGGAQAQTSNAERISAVDVGDVVVTEKMADDFAVKYLGKEVVVEGLTALSDRIMDKYSDKEKYCMDDVNAAISEIGYRVSRLNYKMR